MTKLNRLATPYIFPGQQLYVPVRNVPENDSEDTQSGAGGGGGVDESQEDLPFEEKGKYFTFYLFHNYLMIVFQNYWII